ncbi:MAG TPA: MFS transporter [Polyangiaceae bacterium]|nr:MFS transporter [Polyangiaceae bacterium]
MTSPRSRSWFTFGLLGTLYAAQGLPFGFFSQALPVFLRKQGHSLEAIGFSSFLAAPWAFKFLWAPLVDRHGSRRFGRRRSWIVPLQALSAVLLFALGALSSTVPLSLLLVAVFLTNLFAATQDIATDALALDVLPTERRGFANGIQVAGYRVGMITGGGAILLVFDALGWSASFAVMGAVMLLLSGPVLLLSEPEPTASPSQSPLGGHFLRRKDALPILSLLVTYKFGDAFALSMLRPMLVDQGLRLARIGSLLGVYGFGAGLIGALLGGALVNRVGRKRALVTFGALQAVSVAGYAVLASGDMPLSMLYALTAFEHLAGGMATAALFTSMMDWCRPEHNATDYAVQVSVVVVASAVAAAASGYSAHALGYAKHFWFSAALSILVLTLVNRVFSRVERMGETAS